MLTPKNWGEFQHYKDRSPIWIKLHRKLLDNFEFHRLPVASKALAPLLWLLASEYEDGKITATNEAIAFRLRMSDADFIEALNPLIEADFFTSNSKPLARRKRDAIPETETETQVRDREEKDIRSVAVATRPSAPNHFEDFWKAYPKREGANPKAPARKKFELHVKSGVDPGAMIAAARRYSAQIRADKTEPRFVAQAITWLNQQRFEDYQPTPGAQPMQPPPGAPSDAELRKRYGQQEHRGISPQAEAAGAGQPGGDNTAELRRESPAIRESFGANGVPDNQPRSAGMHRLGAVLPQPSGRGATCVSDADERANSSHDRADAVAGVVRPDVRREPDGLDIPECLRRH